MIAKPWYQLNADEVLQQLGSSRTGLSTAEAQRRLSLHGPNLLKEEIQRGPWPI
ncbi:MAG: cation-transporting P-type ATPase, partial [Nitrospiria bacterium]